MMGETDIPNGVDVGYVDETDSWKLESRFFPSKIGGRPAWLDLSGLPPPEAMECGKCHDPCIFLCQVYAPIEAKDDCFHRTLFVFLCRSAKCYHANDNSSFVVYRSQLTRKNRFYPFEPPEDLEKWAPESKPENWIDLCAACGNYGTSQCGRCKKVKYCCRNHQLIHWKDHHKKACITGDFANNWTSSCLLPEYELIVEPEDNPQQVLHEKSDEINSDEDGNDDDEAEQARLEEFENLAKQGKTGTLSGDASVDADLLSMAACSEDKVFQAFKTRISQSPGQVLRYQRGGDPLWLSDTHVPTSTDIPPCDHCGSRRIFEFQILPQLLNHLSLDNLEESIDWGVLAVYTCENSCTGGPSYKKEFLWKQDVMQ